MKLFDSVQGNLINTRPKRFQGRFSRVGVFPYIIGKKLYWQYRPADEVFSEASVDSFYDVNLTISHPEDDNDDDPEYCHGAVISVEPKPDEGCIDGTFMVMTDEALTKARDQSPLSPMYEVLLKEMSGSFEGRKFDLVQTAIRYTSLGLVDGARQGDEIKVFYQISRDSLTLADKKANNQQLITVPNITADLTAELSPEIVAMGQPIGATTTNRTGSNKTPISLVRELNKRTLVPAGNGNAMRDQPITKARDAEGDEADSAGSSQQQEGQTDEAQTVEQTDGQTDEQTEDQNAGDTAPEPENSDTQENTNSATEDSPADDQKAEETPEETGTTEEKSDNASSTGNPPPDTKPGLGIKEGEKPGGHTGDTDSKEGETPTEKPAETPAPAGEEKPQATAPIIPDNTVNPSATPAPTAPAPESIAPQPVVEPSTSDKNADSEPVAIINSEGGINVQRDYLDTAIVVAQHAASENIMSFDDALHISLSSSHILKSRILAKGGIKLSDWDDVDLAYKVYVQMHPPTLAEQTVPAGNASNGDSADTGTTGKQADSFQSASKKKDATPVAPPPISTPATTTTNRDAVTPSVSHPKHGNLSGNAPPIDEGGGTVLTFEDLE